MSFWLDQKIPYRQDERCYWYWVIILVNYYQPYLQYKGLVVVFLNRSNDIQYTACLQRSSYHDSCFKNQISAGREGAVRQLAEQMLQV